MIYILKMEGVEEANKLAVESCHRVLSIISQPHQDQTHLRNLDAETQQAVSKFKRVVSLLSNSLGHGRARIAKKNRTNSIPQSILLDSSNGPKIESSNQPIKALQILKTNLNEGLIQENGSTTGKSCLSLGGNLSLEMSSSGKTPFQLANPNSSANYQLFQQQKLHLQQVQHQQRMKQHAEMLFRRSNSGINLNFDNSSCTQTMSSSRTLFSSLSVD